MIVLSTYTPLLTDKCVIFVTAALVSISLPLGPGLDPTLRLANAHTYICTYYDINYLLRGKRIIQIFVISGRKYSLWL